MKSRVKYVDNLRSLTVSLLIIYHLAMAYNTWGEANYIFLGEERYFASIVVFISPWFMPLMFLLAGISACYSLKKRNFAQFIKERLVRLGIPLIAGIVLINPILSYVADVTHNGYKGGYLAHYAVYFQRVTDLSGYDGGFTLGHLWFIAALLLFSVVSCGFIACLEKYAWKHKQQAVVWLLIIASIASLDVKVFGKPLVAYFCIYLLGYYLFGSQEFVRSLVKYKWLLTAVFLISSILNVALFVYIEKYELLNNVCNTLSCLAGIPALMCFGCERLDFDSKIFDTFSKLSYVFYIVHFPIVILCQYFLSLTGMDNIYNLAISLAVSFTLTCCLCLLIDKTALLRVLFGLKPKIKEENK